MKRIGRIAAVASSATAVLGIAQRVLLGSAANGLAVGGALLSILVGVVGITALSVALVFSPKGKINRGDFLRTWKRLLKAAFLSVAVAVALSVVMGVVAVLLQRGGIATERVMRILEWTSLGLAAVLLPAGVHAFFRAGLYGDGIRDSLFSLKRMYVKLLLVTVVLLGVGRAAAALALPWWAGAVLSVVLLTSVILLLLRLYEQQSRAETADDMEG